MIIIFSSDSFKYVQLLCLLFHPSLIHSNMFNYVKIHVDSIRARHLIKCFDHTS